MKKIITLAVLTILFFPLKMYAEGSSMNAHEFSFTAMDGSEIKLSDYKGKALMVVNTACLCGFTPQFADMQKLYEEYKDKGFEIVGVPSNDFGGQELDSEEEVKKFVDDKFKVTFPLTSITKVKGDDAHPFYKWVAEETSWLGKPKWNFHKYIIDPQGNFVNYFSSTTSPNSDKVKKAIESVLP